MILVKRTELLDSFEFNSCVEQQKKVNGKDKQYHKVELTKQN